MRKNVFTLLICLFFMSIGKAAVINHDISSGCLIINGNSNDDYVITGSTSNTNNYVEVQFGYKGTITLSNCSFNFTSSGVHSPIRICGKNNLSNTDPSRTNVNIILEGDNYIYNEGSGRACIQVDQGAQINISAIEPCDNSSGTLTAIQMATSGGAAIGSLCHDNNTNETTASVLLSNGSTGTTAGGNVVISSGTVTAKGGHGAGIGGGYRTYYDGMIVIYGGIVDATTIYHAAGIGSGCPRGTGVVTEYAPNSAIVALPPAAVSAKGADGSGENSELGLAGTKVRIYIGDPAKPNIKVYTEDYLPDANVYVDLSQDPDINYVVTTTVNASLLDINQVLFGSTDASGIFSTTGQLQNNTTFFTDATSKSAATLGRPYLPTATALPNGGEVKLDLLEANFTIENFGAKILETGYTGQQAADSATCIKITYNDNIPITDLNFDFANGSNTDFCQPIFFDSDSLTVVPVPTSFQNGDIYYITIPIQNSKPSKIYSDVLRIIGNWNGVSTSYIRQIISQIVAFTHIEHICEGESYLFHDQLLTEPGQYTNVTSTSGCNPESEVERLYLTVNPNYDTLFIDTICQGDSYLQNGFMLGNMTPGNYFDSLFLNTIYGCDSIVKLNLFVRPSFDTLIFDTICYGDNYLENNFNILTPPSGLYQDTLFLNNIYGCDSIVRLNLTVNPSYDIEINENICHGEDYIDNGFVFEDMTPGYYSETLFLNTIYGCDSIVKLNLTVSPIYDIEINDVACQGDDYLENGFAIESLQVGTYSETLFLNSIHGCDSVVKLNLVVNESFHFEIYDSICYGEDYTLYGLNLTQPNVGIDNYTSNYQTILGCDSIFNVTLKVLDVYDEIEIVGEELLLVSTNLTTGCYLYTVGENEEDRTYSWKINNEDWKIEANNNECLVWATTPEECTLTVTGGNSCGIVTDFIELTADFFDEVNNSKVMMYPNPAKNHLNIKHNDIYRINVYDSYGQLILRNDYNLDNQVMLDLNSLESSIYIIEIITPEQTFIERISIIK